MTARPTRRAALAQLSCALAWASIGAALPADADGLTSFPVPQSALPIWNEFSDEERRLFADIMALTDVQKLRVFRELENTDPSPPVRRIVRFLEARLAICEGECA